MSNKFIPNLSVTDGFDFVKKIWGSLPIPNVIQSTTDLDELDKRIADLKAVEQWLNVNLSMLRATIQGLEVQRGTVATIKSFGANLGLSSDEANKVDPQMLQMAVAKMMAQQQPQSPVPSNPVAARVPEAEPNTKPAADVEAEEKARSRASRAKAALDEAEESSKAIISNATAWWGLLQDQLNKVATAAMTGAGLGEEESIKDNKTPEKPKRATSSKRKPATGAKSTRASKGKTSGS